MSCRVRHKGEPDKKGGREEARGLKLCPKTSADNEYDNDANSLCESNIGDWRTQPSWDRGNMKMVKGSRCHK